MVAACLLASAAAAGTGCGQGRDGSRSQAPDSAALAQQRAIADSAAAIRASLPVRYTRSVVRSPAVLRALRDSLGETRWRHALRVNRVDSAHVRQGDTLVVPQAGANDFALSGFPASFPAARDTSRLLLVSLRTQAFAAYDSGRLSRWGPVSTGRRSKPTPVGLYHTNWKDKERISTFDEGWLLRWYVNLDNFQGVSLHEYELPGRPASHSCVRLLREDAMWLYQWAQEWRVGPDRRTVLSPGTPVVVFGEWNWKGRAPWKKLPEDAFAATLGPEELVDATRVMTAGTSPKYVSLEEPGERPRPPRADSLRVRPDSLRANRSVLDSSGRQ